MCIYIYIYIYVYIYIDLNSFYGLFPERQGQNLASTVLHVPGLRQREGSASSEYVTCKTVKAKIWP